MKRVFLILTMAAVAAAASAQTTTTPAKPATTAPKTTATTAKATTPAKTAAASTLPPGVPAVKGVVKTAFALRYQDIAIGSGVDAEPNKVYWVKYTGWLAADGRVFDASANHPATPMMDRTMKPIMGEDGKPKMAAGQPIQFPQGYGRVIPGWDQGFGGMKIGGKRRLFVPWQLAYGAKDRPGPDAAHPGIPAKSDLIFDVELVDVTDMPAQPARPPMGAMPQGARPTPGQPGAPGGRPQGLPLGTPASAPGAAPAPATAPTPAAPAPAPAAPAQPAQPKTPPPPSK